MRGKKGVSVIIGTIVLIVIGVSASAILYSLYAPSLVPTVDTNKILEEIVISKLDVSNGTDLTVYILNKGKVDVLIDRIYIEDLAENWESSTPFGTFLGVNDVSSFFVTAASSINDTKVIKAVTSKGTTAQVLYVPTTSVNESTPEGGSGSNYTRFSITVFKFTDLNINGIYEPGLSESPITNWTFYLWNGDVTPAVPITSNTTNASGYYVFENLDKGKYIVKENPETPNFGGYPLWFNSSPADYLVEINTKSESIEIGNYPVTWTCTINGYVINDTDSDGIFDPGEPGLPGWNVTLMRMTGIPELFNVTTDSMGFYQRSGLANGKYVVVAWPDRTNPMWVWSATSPNPNTTTVVGTVTERMNFSFHGSASTATNFYHISGYVFNDTSVGGLFPDGVYNPLQNDTLLPHIVIGVYNGSSPYFLSVTNSSGYFDILVEPGIYRIEVQPNWDDWDPTTDSTYSDLDLTASNRSVAFGLYYNPLGEQALYITGVVFDDLNDNGVQDANETGISGINVYRNDTSTYVSTDANGTFIFNNQPKGNWTIFLDNGTMALQLPGYMITTYSSVDISTLTSPVSGLAFGVYQVGKINGTVYYERDNTTGFNPASDYGIPDVTILLNGTISTRTDANGYYEFTGLTPGYYEVQEVPLYGWNYILTIINSTYPVSTRVVVVDDNITPQTVDYLNEPQTVLRYNVSGTIFLDDDRDGINDIAYPGGDSPFRTSRTVYIRYANGTSITSTSSSSTTGGFTFTNLAAGEDYIVYINSITGYLFTTPLSALLPNMVGNQTLDFGIYSTSSVQTFTISGIKYNDSAPFGTLNTGDVPITNWGIYLYSGTNTSSLPIMQNYTYNGNYFFDNIAPGIYTIVELVEPGWANMTSSAVTLNVTDHAVVDFYNNYTAFSVGTNLYTISGRVFNDIDSSGTYNTGDGVLNGRLVILYDQYGLPIDSTTSNSNGLYSFANLASSNYSLMVQVPSGYTNTTPYYQPVINLSSNITIDFGLRQLSVPITYTVNGYVFWDKDADGIWEYNPNPNQNETPLSGWILYLYSGSYSPYFGQYFPGPTPIATTTTNGSGYYYFAGLGNSTYTVVSRLTQGYVNTTPRQVTFTISGAPYINASFGNDNVNVVTKGDISGYKYNDSDNSASYTAGETRLNNWTMWLADSAGYPIRSNVTNFYSGGAYGFIFPGLPNGNYVVYEQLANQALWTNSTPGVINVTISGSSVSGLSYGNRLGNATPTYLISGSVYNDTDRDNNFDDGGAVMTGVWTIFLYTGSYSPYTFPARITTTTGGQYTFSGLSNGVYTVVEVLQSGYTNVWARSRSVTISGASMTNQSFFNKWIGAQPTFLVYGYKYNDTDLDKVWNTTIPDESALSGWQIAIYDQFGFPLANTTTSSSGYYSFSVPNGTYTLAENLTGMTGWTYSTPYQANITVANTTVRYDFGNYMTGRAPAYSIYGWVFNDTNLNRIQDAGELGLSGWTMTLKTPTGTSIKTTTTNSSGFYIFSSLSPASYRVDSTRASTAYTNTSASIVNVTLTTTDMSQNYSWYYNYTPVVPLAISGRVYNNINTAGNGLANWTVIVTNGTYINSKLTDATGNYSFTLADGSYTVQAVVTGGYYNITPSIVNVVLSGSSRIVDFGMNSTASLPIYTVRGLKFNDLNKNGVNDSDELGIASWGFILYNATNLFSSFTDASGIFTFDGLRAGTYTVNETARGGWAASNWTSLSVNVTSNGTFLYFGNYINFTAGLNYSVSGYVFNDTGKNSAYDGPDLPLNNWLVTLSDYRSIIIDSMQTDAAGRYNFSSLAGGEYTVTSWKTGGDGWINTTASNVKVQITNASITNLNFGYYYDRYDVRGFVFFDGDKNGVYQNLTVGETPLAGWQVLLRNELGDTLIAITDSNGQYVFSDRPPGLYTLSTVSQPGWNATSPASVVFTLSSDTTQNFGNKRYYYGQFLTYDRYAWSTDSNGYLSNNISAVYGSSWVVTIGSAAVYQSQWDNMSYVKGYLVNSVLANVLDSDYSNPNGLGAGQGGTLGANILALKFNVDYDNANIGLFNFGTSEHLDDLHIFNYSSVVNGKTVGEVLANANTFIGTGSGSMTAAQYNTLIERINNAFSGPDYTDATYFLY